MAATVTMELTPMATGKETSEPPARTAVEPSANTTDDTVVAPVEKKATTAIIITTIAGVTVISSMVSGIVTISLPVMAKDLEIPDALLLWPASVYALTSGCTLILAGAIADVVGARGVYLFGSFMISVFTLACGLSRTSIQMIVFRAFHGLANACVLPSAVSLITSYFAPGRQRNLAFAIMSGGNPMGFIVGLVMGGAMTDSVGWQIGFYIAAAINSILFVFAFFGLPKLVPESPLTLARLRSDIDWIGAFILSTALALLLYVFSTWTGDIRNIKSAESISILVVGIALLPAFGLWMHRQETLGKTVLIRNSLWRNKRFTSICMNVFLTWGSFNATETFLTFLFQDVQELSATAASVRFMPEVVSGFIMNVLVGLYVHRLRADWTLVMSFIVSAIAPLLLAVSRRGASYWEFEFPAIALVPISTDVLFTISQLIITAEFDDKTQGLAGGVFNTAAQIGKSVGLALSAVVAGSVTGRVDAHTGGTDLLKGYRAAWWFTFATTVACIFVTFLGLRNIGKVGLKRE